MLGSFCTAVIYRERHGESWIWNKKEGAGNSSSNKARSFCPSCLHVLSVKDLIPVFSWLFQRGKCRYCKKDIAASYIVTECFFVFLTLVLSALFGFTVTAFILMALLPFIVAQTVLLFKDKKSSNLLIATVLMGIVLLFFCNIGSWH